MADTTISFRIEHGKREKLEELAKAAGFPRLSSFMRELIDARLSDQPRAEGDACASQTHERPFDRDNCPLLKILAKIRCQGCVLRKQENDPMDPGPPPE
jgi:hypothetical protein